MKQIQEEQISIFHQPKLNSVCGKTPFKAKKLDKRMSKVPQYVLNKAARRRMMEQHQ